MLERWLPKQSVGSNPTKGVDIGSKRPVKHVYITNRSAFQNYCVRCEGLVESERQSSWVMVKCCFDKCKCRDS